LRSAVPLWRPTMRRKRFRKFRCFRVQLFPNTKRNEKECFVDFVCFVVKTDSKQEFKNCENFDYFTY
jgi:hypothetical protein